MDGRLCHISGLDVKYCLITSPTSAKTTAVCSGRGSAHFSRLHIDCVRRSRNNFTTSTTIRQRHRPHRQLVDALVIQGVANGINAIDAAATRGIHRVSPWASQGCYKHVIIVARPQIAIGIATLNDDSALHANNGIANVCHDRAATVQSSMTNAQSIYILLDLLQVAPITCPATANTDTDPIITGNGNGIRNDVRSITAILDDAAVHDIVVVCTGK